MDPNRIIPQPTRQRVPSEWTFLLDESVGVTPPAGSQDTAAIGPWQKDDGRDASIVQTEDNNAFTETHFDVHFLYLLF